MTKRKQWDELSVRNSAKKYFRKVDFKRSENGGYQAMCRRFPHLIDELFKHRPSKYTRETLIEIATQYPDRKSFELNERGPSCACYTFFPGLLDEVFERKIKPRNHWTLDRLRLEAGNFKTKEDFYRGALGAYNAAVKMGVIDDLGFVPGGTMDNNVIYVWKALGVTFNGEQVYKIGVSSARVGRSRIKTVSRRAGIHAEVVCFKVVSGKATWVERELLKIGQNPRLTGFVGCSEFRALTSRELDVVKSVVDLL